MTDLKSLTDAELRSENRAILRELSARRMASRPKPRKVRDVAERERAAKYVAFREEFCNGPCWNCGDARRPLDRAHVTKPGLGRRLEDDRLVIAICRRCHDAYHEGKLTVANMLWLKKTMHPEKWDRRFLEHWSMRKLPEPEEPTYERT